MRQETKRRLGALSAIVALTALAVWIDGPWHPQIAIGEWRRDLRFKLGLDLQGGSHLVYRADVSGIASADVPDLLAGVRDVIERRVNAFGVAEPVVQTNQAGNEQRIIVELAGVHDPRQAIRLIGETPQLDFRREVNKEEATAQFNIDDSASITGPIFERTQLSGKHLKRSSVSFEQVIGQPQVALEFNSEGAELFAELTKQNLGHRIAIYLDSVPISAPVVQTEITNGQAVISGGFSLEEAKQLSQRLNAGALPVAIELIGQQSIGPSLGQTAIRQSIVAGSIGLIAVVVWMLFFYRLLGIIASFALVLYALYFLAIVKLLPVTLTLAGVAGIILTVGMAVDANILIFERFRENMRDGKAIGFALADGFSDAWDSIKASNISGLLMALILYSLGTSIVKGFALTFAIGVTLSMFTAISITRTILYLILSWRKLHRPFLLAVPSKQITP